MINQFRFLLPGEQEQSSGCDFPELQRLIADNPFLSLQCKTPDAMHQASLTANRQIRLAAADINRQN
jgi:hypothetical protein